MYNIGVDQSNAAHYIEKLDNSAFNIVKLSSENIDTFLPDLHGVILQEENEQDMSKNCGMILKIREQSNPFIWVFLSNPANVQKMIYLQLGADGIFSKENEPEEIKLVINNSLNRYHHSSKEEVSSKKIIEEMKQQTGLELRPDSLSIRLGAGQKEIALTKMEFKLLELLYENRSNGLSYQKIFEYLWGEEYDDNKFRISNLIFHLREKLEDGNIDSRIIKTIRSKGYMLSLDE